MEPKLEHARDELNQEISSHWLQLSARVRRHAEALSAKAAGSALAADSEALAVETHKLCDHFDRLHLDVEKLLLQLDDTLGDELPSPTETEPEEVQREAIRIQQESHEMRADLKDVIKALFMWRDDPAERARDKN